MCWSGPPLVAHLRRLPHARGLCFIRLARLHPGLAGEPYRFGLEVGSKAELVMVMSQLAGRPAGTNLVCNGYKDSEYMELVSRAGARPGTSGGKWGLQSWAGLGSGHQAAEGFLQC